MALRSGRVGIHPSQVDPITGMLLNSPTPGSMSFEDLSDAQISNPEVGQTLIYNGTGWENETPSVTPTTLSALQDVQITDVEDGEYLVYDGANSKWINSGSAPGPVVPEGSTVTPTDDIQTWLACAGITDKTYTTLNEVLADSTTLLALISDNNAVDYLVRSTSWATASNIVPTMTSNTTPSGECGDSSSSAEAYWAFDGNDTTSDWSASGSSNKYVYYKFPTAEIIKKVRFKTFQNRCTSYKILGSNTQDVDAATELFSDTTSAYDAWVECDLSSNSTPYQYIYFYVVTSGSSYCGVREVELYRTNISTGICDNSTAMTDIGANNYCANNLLDDATWCDAICNSTYFESVLNVKVPTMTSNTTPSGEVLFDSSLVGTGGTAATDYYKVFNGVTTDTVGLSADKTSAQRFGYDFGERVKIYKVGVYGCHATGTEDNCKMIATDDTTWNDIASFGTYTSINTAWTYYTINSNSTAYQKWAFSAAKGTAYSLAFNEFQFYGRQDI